MKRIDDEQTARATLALLPDVVALEKAAAKSPALKKKAATVRAQVVALAKRHGVELAGELV